MCTWFLRLSALGLFASDVRCAYISSMDIWLVFIVPFKLPYSSTDVVFLEPVLKMSSFTSENRDCYFKVSFISSFKALLLSCNWDKFNFYDCENFFIFLSFFETRIPDLLVFLFYIFFFVDFSFFLLSDIWAFSVSKICIWLSTISLFIFSSTPFSSLNFSSIKCPVLLNWSILSLIICIFLLIYLLNSFILSFWSFFISICFSSIFLLYSSFKTCMNILSFESILASMYLTILE